MLNRLVDASTNYLVRRNVIHEEDRDVYEYGFHSLYNNIIDIASIVIISILLNQVSQTILYHISFISLRTVAGGFHAKTHFRCFVMSTAIWLTSLWGIANMGSSLICISLAGISVVLIWATAPIEHDNNPLSVKKYKNMMELSRIISAIFFLLILFLVVSNVQTWVTASLAYGMASHSVLIVVAILQQIIRKKDV